MNIHFQCLVCAYDILHLKLPAILFLLGQALNINPNTSNMDLLEFTSYKLPRGVPVAAV